MTSVSLHTQLSSVMESLVHAAVAQLKTLVEDGADFLLSLEVRAGEAGEEPPLPARVRAESREKMVLFASIMETLGNEALGKIMNIVDEAQQQGALQLTRSGRRPQTSVLNVLSKALVEMEHSYGLRPQITDNGTVQTPPRVKQEKEGAEPPFVAALSVKDERGNIDLSAIAERARDEADRPLPLQDVSSSPESLPHSAPWTSFTPHGDVKAQRRVHAGEKPFAFRLRQSAQNHTRLRSGERPHECAECGKCFAKQAQLKTHGVVHTGERPHGCHVCGRRFNLVQNLQRHAHTHTGAKLFVCGVCGKGFTRAVTLKSHQLIHSGHKPYECDECPKTFRHAVNLKNHQRIHSGARPFTCDLCGKSFRQSMNLKIHRRVHTGERPFGCGECGKTFSQQSSLIAHGRTHSDDKPFCCGFCDKKFNNANSLKLHRRVHTGEKPYACDVCAKTFSQGSHLRTHQRHVHAGGKQYICDKCGKTYSDQRNLKLHKCSYA